MGPWSNCAQHFAAYLVFTFRSSFLSHRFGILSSDEYLSDQLHIKHTRSGKTARDKHVCGVEIVQGLIYYLQHQ